MRQVEENALQLGVFFQDFRDLRTVAATDVRNHANSRKLVSVENGIRFTTMNTDHRRIENPGLVGMLAQVIENRFAENLVEGNLAGANAVVNLCPGTKLLIA